MRVRIKNKGKTNESKEKPERKENRENDSKSPTTLEVAGEKKTSQKKTDLAVRTCKELH